MIFTERALHESLTSSQLTRLFFFRILHACTDLISDLVEYTVKIVQQITDLMGTDSHSISFTNCLAPVRFFVASNDILYPPPDSLFFTAPCHVRIGLWCVALFYLFLHYTFILFCRDVRVNRVLLKYFLSYTSSQINRLVL